MRIGVIGCGGMGTTHYLSLKVLSEKEDDVEVVALSDCRKEFLDKAASYFPEAATYEYGMELIEKEQLYCTYLSSKLSACRTCSEGTGKRDECTGGKTGMSDRRGLPDAS